MRRFLSTFACALFFCGLVQSASAQTYVPGTEATWYGSVGTIMLTRENPEAAQIARGLLGTPLIDTSAVDFDPQFGYDTTIGRRLGDGFGVEARYFDVNMGTNLPTFTDPFGVATTFNYGDPSSQLGAAGGTTVAQSKYKSELQSFELNLRQQTTPNIGVLYGFRYFELAEELALTYSSSIPVIGRQSIRGRNEMFGAQLGFDALLLDRDWWTVTTFAKSGLYYNAARADANTDSSAFGFSQINQSSGKDDQLAFACEAGLKFNLQLTRRVSLQTGYNLMWLDNVALASDQIAASNPTASGTLLNPTNPTVPSGVDTRQLFLHGLTLGLTYAW